MSIDHSFDIATSGNTRITLNISGLDSGECSVGSLSGSIYAYDISTGNPKFTCQLSICDIQGLYSHLDKYEMIRKCDVKNVGKFIEISENTEEIFEYLSKSNSNSLIFAIKRLIKSTLSNEDLNIILGRKESLQEFERMLKQDDISEKDWQTFFENNEWIFGYGLKYRYLKILQREAHVSQPDVGGDNEVIADYLLSDLKFTRLVEIKRPDTPLFKRLQNRSDSWRLLSELSDSVSQILSQKANWELSSQKASYTKDGTQITELSHDVECILIIGMRKSTDGTDREIAMKLKTLELYRRNLRHIDIITYDELFERASFIINDRSEK